MLKLDVHAVGRHFLQFPGPSPLPDRILRAASLPTIDRRGPEIAAWASKVRSGMREIFQTRHHPGATFPASGTGAWEAARVNTLSPGDHLLMDETCHFASLWQRLATRQGLDCEVLALSAGDEVLPIAPLRRRYSRGISPVQSRASCELGERGQRREREGRCARLASRSSSCRALVVAFTNTVTQ
jgi:alanine-glyoxylate transaminase/serine-glyoxylate transaminase/serine-pyruvate transaminase